MIYDAYSLISVWSLFNLQIITQLYLTVLVLFLAVHFKTLYQIQVLHFNYVHHLKSKT